MRRLFIALWPEPDVREHLYICQQNLSQYQPVIKQARVVKTENLHLTVQFLGAVNDSSIPRLTTELARLHLPSFELQFQTLGYFAGPRILWLGLEIPQPALLDLVESVRKVVADSLPDCLSDTDAYTPHISLFRHCAPVSDSLNCDLLNWPVRQFALLESVQGVAGVGYRVVDSWRLV